MVSYRTWDAGWGTVGCDPLYAWPSRHASQLRRKGSHPVSDRSGQASFPVSPRPHGVLQDSGVHQMKAWGALNDVHTCSHFTPLFRVPIAVAYATAQARLSPSRPSGTSRDRQGISVMPTRTRSVSSTGQPPGWLWRREAGGAAESTRRSNGGTREVVPAFESRRMTSARGPGSDRGRSGISQVGLERPVHGQFTPTQRSIGRAHMQLVSG